jgi:hypothetical protein
LVELTGVFGNWGDCGVAVTTTLLLVLASFVCVGVDCNEELEALALTGVWVDCANSVFATTSGGAIAAVDCGFGEASMGTV